MSLRALASTVIVGLAVGQDQQQALLLRPPAQRFGAVAQGRPHAGVESRAQCRNAGLDAAVHGFVEVFEDLQVDARLDHHAKVESALAPTGMAL